MLRAMPRSAWSCSKRRWPIMMLRSTSGVHHSPTISSDWAMLQLKWATLLRFTPRSVTLGCMTRCSPASHGTAPGRSSVPLRASNLDGAATSPDGRGAVHSCEGTKGSEATGRAVSHRGLVQFDEDALAGADLGGLDHEA